MKSGNSRIVYLQYGNKIRLTACNISLWDIIKIYLYIHVSIYYYWYRQGKKQQYRFFFFVVFLGIHTQITHIWIIFFKFSTTQWYFLNTLNFAGILPKFWHDLQMCILHFQFFIFTLKSFKEVGSLHSLGTLAQRNGFLFDIHCTKTFPLRISSVNVTKSADVLFTVLYACHYSVINSFNFFWRKLFLDISLVNPQNWCNYYR